MLTITSASQSRSDRDFGYVGSSNSQMRDSGAYFMEKCSKRRRQEYRKLHNEDPPRDFQPKIDALREKLGRFVIFSSGVINYTVHSFMQDFRFLEMTTAIRARCGIGRQRTTKGLNLVASPRQGLYFIRIFQRFHVYQHR